MKKTIKAFFRNHSSLKIKAKELSKKIAVKSPQEYALLKQELHKLVKEEFLIKEGKRYTLKTEKTGKLTGKLQLNKNESFGFVILKNSDVKDIFIPEKFLSTAMNGDTVEVSLLAQKRGKNLEGQIINIIERKREEIVGTLKKSSSFFFVYPDEKEIGRDIYVSKQNLNGAAPGDKVVVGDIEWKSRLLNPEGKVTEVLGKAGTYDTEISALAREFNLSYSFSADVLEEVETKSEKIEPEEIKRRVDLRDKITFTIDPATAKDFDDAVSIENLSNGNYLLGIHIADVSHYVLDGSSVYQEAYKRGTSVYLVGKVIPMLPEKLSNKICSLVPNEDRLTYSVLAEVNHRGKIISYDIKKTIINSKRRFTYEEVQNILDEQKGEFYEQLAIINKIAKSLRKKRIKKGSINFHTPEVEIELNKDGIPLNINIKEIKESHNLIEELMLLANQVVSKHIKQNKNKIAIPFVYRVHDLPDNEKLVEFSKFVNSLGYSFDHGSLNNSVQFQILLDQVKGTEEEAVVNELAIRSMAKAEYSIENIGHYGLGFKFYTHFTSPIRRFPDLIVHKLIYEYIENRDRSYKSVRELNDICEHSSFKERSAVNAERLSVKLKQMEFLRSKTGEDFHGIISGITHFGIFVELCKNLAEGLIHIRELDDDYYIFDDKNYLLKGRSSGRKLRLGDKVNVKLIRVDEEKREIDFVLLDN